MNAGEAENDKKDGVGSSTDVAGTTADNIERRKKRQSAPLGLGLAFVIAAVLIMLDQPVWGLSMGGSVAIISIVRAVL